MSDQVAGAAAPASPPSVVVPPAQPAAPAPAAAEQEPAWLAGRLARERESTVKALLADLGVADPKDAKAALSAYKQSQDAAKSEEQRLRDQVAKLAPLETEIAALRSVITEQAKAELSALTDAQRQTVQLLAGDDPAKQVSTIANLRRGGLLTTTTAGVAPAPVAPAPIPPPASTAAAAAAPPASTPAAPNHLATWETLKKANPMEAAQYLLRNRAAISAAQKAATPSAQ